MSPIVFSPTPWLAALAGLLGLAALASGLTGAVWLGQWLPGLHQMGVVSPLLLIAAAAIVLARLFARQREATTRHPRLRPAVLLGLPLVLLPVLMLIEHAAGVSLGVDWTLLSNLPTPDVPHPGRLSPNACVGFLAVGIALLLPTGASASRRGERLFSVLAGLVLLIGVSALTGYFLRLEGLYRLAGYNRMLLPTAMGLTLLGAALWVLRDARGEPDRSSFDHHEKRIARRSRAVLTLVALAAGVAGFGALRDSFDKAISDKLLLTARTNAASLAQTLEAALGQSAQLGDHPAVFSALRAAPGSPLAAQSADRLLSGDTLGVQVLDAERRLQAESGVLSAAAPWESALGSAHGNARLLWNGGYRLRTDRPVTEGGRTIGHLVTEQRLPGFDRVMKEVHGGDDSSDALICHRRDEQVLCAPSRYRPAPFALDLVGDDDDPAARPPAARAVLGERGVGRVKDSRGVEVVAAFTPLDDWPLGLVVKTGEEALFAPLKDRVAWLVIALALLVGLGSYSMHNRVHPLVMQILAEQRRTRNILDHANDAFIALGHDGRVTDWNAQAEFTFGWSSEEAIGRPLGELIVPPAQRVAHAQGFARFVRTGTGPVIDKRIELMALHRSGRELPVELSISSFHDGEGYVAHAFVRDISERRAAEQQLALSEKRLRAMTDNIPALLSHVDDQQRYLFANRQIARMFRTTPEQLIGRDIAVGREPELVEVIHQHLKRVYAGERVTYQGTTRVHGREHHFEATYVPDFHEDGHVQGFFAMTYDVTERRNNELRIAADEHRLRLITDNLPVVVLYLDRDERVTFLNATFEQWSGIPVAQVIGQPLVKVIGRDLYEQRLPYIRRAMAGERITFELVSKTLGIERHMEMVYVPDVNERGEVVGIHTMTTDVTAFRRIEAELAQLARFDTLTGLPNRHALNEKLDEALARSRRRERPLAALFLDVDRFKHINDTYGHAAGDAVLVEFARRLKAAVRVTDTVGRLAGDEFVVVLEDLHTVDEARAVAGKIVTAMAGDWPLPDGRMVAVSTSVGVAFTQRPMSREELLALADKALYAAKAAGRNTFRAEEAMA
jgi:diguanylate cyclase (GGDEF)-like protein/PAS domain S-box-containing protein